MPKLTPAEAAALARDVLACKPRSYVGAARQLAEYLLSPDPESATDDERYGKWFRQHFACRVSVLSPIQPQRGPDGPPLLGSRLYIFDDRHRAVLTVLPLAVEPDPFPPETPAPQATRTPGEHRLNLPPTTNRPPALTDMFDMIGRKPGDFGDELVPAPRTSVSSRPDPYVATHPTPLSNGIAPPPFDPAPNTTGKLRCNGYGCLDARCDCDGPHPIHMPRLQQARPEPPPPIARVYCGVCDHEFCTCPRYEPAPESGS